MMRWHKRPKKQEPSAGDLRDREGFLFFPKTINRQTRWLERASWTEKFVDSTCYTDGTAYWIPIRWSSA